MSLEKPVYFQGTTKYPQSKEIAGASYWSTMHNGAARLKPSLHDELTPQEIRTFHQWLLYTAAHFVCDMCDLTPWIQTNAITGTKRVDMERYVCRMHNFVNKKTGKMLHDCTTIHEEKDRECHSCKYQSQMDSIDKVVMNDTKVANTSIAPDVDRMNDARKKIFERLCEREGIPVPTVKFARCPQAPYESCVVPGSDGYEIYLDPDPVRSIAHEYGHYLKHYKKDIAGAYNEYEIDREAQALVEKELGNQQPELKLSAVPAMHDTPAPIRSVHAPVPAAIPDRMESVMKRFPMYAKRVKEAEAQKRRDHSTSYQSDAGMDSTSVRESRGTGGGFLGGLDGLFKPFADIMGIPSHTANTMHMSNTIGYVVNMIVNTTSSPFGASVASFFGSLLLFAAGAFGKGDIGQEDRKILFGIISNIFNNNIALLGNSRTRESIMRSANLAGYALSRLDFDMLIKTLTMDPTNILQAAATGSIPPEQYRGVGKAPGPPVSPAGGIGSGGGGFGGGGSGGGILGGGVPVGGGVDTRFQLEGPLRGTQDREFNQAVARRRPAYNPNYSPPLDVPPGYGGIPELDNFSQDVPELEENMNVTNGGIDSLPEIDFGFRGGQQPRPQKSYPYEEDFGF